MYRFYYNHEIPGDVLFVVIDPTKKVTSSTRNGDIVTLLCNGERVGINLFCISKHIKIPHDGAFLGNDAQLFAAVNILLLAEKLPPLKRNDNSGYFVAKVLSLEEHPLEEKAHIVTLSLLEKKVQTVSLFTNLKVGEKVVVKINGSPDNEGKLFLSHIEKNIPIDVLICNAYELGISSKNEESAYLAIDKNEGMDFFA